MIRTRHRIFAIITVMMLAGCGDVATAEVDGVWTIDSASRKNLPNDRRNDDVSIDLRGDGTFSSTPFPEAIEKFESFGEQDRLYAINKESGSGTWELTKRGGNQVVYLHYQGDVGFELYAEKNVLFYFVGDPDSHVRVAFRQ